MTMVHKTDKIVIFAMIILVSYKCRSNIDVPYINSNSWLTYELIDCNIVIAHNGDELYKVHLSGFT